MLLAGALTAVLLISRVSYVIVVPPPTNVTVSCQNLKTTVSWNYSKQQMETSFTVDIKGCNFKRNFMDETTDHLYDLSPFLWQYKECYMGYLYVTVMAIQGGNNSEAVPSNSFSFNYLEIVDTTCELEFPPVDVNVDEKRTLVKFQNPFYFYKELKMIHTSNDVLQLKFTVISVRNVESDAFCTVKHTICKLYIETFPEDVEKCVKLRGVLFIGKGTNQVPLSETNWICSHKPTEKHVLLLAVILLGALALLIIAAVIIICEVKAWTMQTPVYPRILVTNLSQGPHHWEMDNRNTTVDTQFVSNPQQGLTAHCEDNHLLSDYDSNPLAYLERIRTLAGDHPELETVDSMSGANGAKGSLVFTESSAECFFTDKDEEESVSAYDCPHNIDIDMGDGDMVTGYSGK